MYMKICEQENRKDKINKIRRRKYIFTSWDRISKKYNVLVKQKEEEIIKKSQTMVDNFELKVSLKVSNLKRRTYYNK